MKSLALVLVAVMCAIGCLVAVVPYMEKRDCLARWEESGFPARYTQRAGCAVMVKAGQWVPEKAIKLSP